MSEPIGQGLHHYVLPKDDPVAALNILRVIADGRCEQPGTTKPRRTMVCQQAGPAWLLAGRHPRITAGAIDDAALGVMTIGVRRAILLSEDGVYRHRLAI
jgi:hypothetical protein